MALSWKHVVPWTSRAEFMQIYLDLYIKNAVRQRNAVEMISLWKCRAVNKLSVAIESSAALTEAYLQYEEALEGGTILQKEFNLRTMLSMALIRFVNHITEKGQNKAFAQPVHKIAQEFGIPDWIVRLRHDATHGSLPCLDVLTMGVQWALSYLQDVFWSQQVKEKDECTDPSERKRKRPRRGLYSTAEIQELLHNYQTTSQKSLEDDPDNEAAREENRALRRIEYVLNGPRRNCVLSSLVGPGHLLPTEQQLKAYQVTLEDTVQGETPKVPGIFIKIWRQLLQLLQEKQLTSLLLQHMLTMMLAESDPVSLTSVTLTAWIRLILLYEASNFTKTAGERAAQPVLYTSAVEYSTTLLLFTCVQTPTIWTCSLLPLLGDTDCVSVDVYGKLNELGKIYRGSTVNTGDEDPTDKETAKGEEGVHLTCGKVFSLSSEDVKCKSSHKKASKEENCWTLCTEPVDWDRVALGLLPSQIGLLETSSTYENRSHGSSTSEDDGCRSSEDEPDAAVYDPLDDNRKESTMQLTKDDVPDAFDVH